MDLSLFFAGTGGSVPSPRRGLPAILLRRGGDRLLFDCGESPLPYANVTSHWRSTDLPG
jgi:ribonuclease BN (tRNA processing enzyme)